MRMAHKLENVQIQMKAQRNNQAMVEQLTRITPFIQQHALEMPIEQMANQLTQFESAMDEITVTHKIMDDIMNKDTMGADLAVEGMMA